MMAAIQPAQAGPADVLLHVDAREASRRPCASRPRGSASPRPSAPNGGPARRRANVARRPRSRAGLRRARNPYRRAPGVVVLSNCAGRRTLSSRRESLVDRRRSGLDRPDPRPRPPAAPRGERRAQRRPGRLRLYSRALHAGSPGWSARSWRRAPPRPRPVPSHFRTRSGLLAAATGHTAASGAGGGIATCRRTGGDLGWRGALAAPRRSASSPPPFRPDARLAAWEPIGARRLVTRQPLPALRLRPCVRPTWTRRLCGRPPVARRPVWAVVIHDGRTRANPSPPCRAWSACPFRGARAPSKRAARASPRCRVSEGGRRAQGRSGSARPAPTILSSRPVPP
jgi:hypothetical protein